MKNVIIAHKDFDLQFGNYVNSKYEAITTHDLKTNIKLTKFETDLPDEIFGEITYIKYLLENWEDPNEWVSLNHYRRIFQPLETCPCYAEPLTFPGRLYEQTCWYHSKTIIDRFIAFLEKRTDGMPNAFKQTMCDNKIIPYNIFSGPKCVFEAWYNVVALPIIDFINKDLNVHTVEDANKFILSDADALVQRQGKNIDLTYQSRFGGFLCERMNTMFWSLYFNGAFPCNVKLLEDGQKI